jgi:hypothetical protein
LRLRGDRGRCSAAGCRDAAGYDQRLSDLFGVGDGRCLAGEFDVDSGVGDFSVEDFAERLRERRDALEPPETTDCRFDAPAPFAPAFFTSGVCFVMRALSLTSGLRSAVGCAVIVAICKPHATAPTNSSEWRNV